MWLVFIVFNLCAYQLQWYIYFFFFEKAHASLVLRCLININDLCILWLNFLWTGLISCSNWNQLSNWKGCVMWPFSQLYRTLPVVALSMKLGWLGLITNLIFGNIWTKWLSDSDHVFTFGSLSFYIASCNAPKIAPNLQF